jgi:hypothetical protein
MLTYIRRMARPLAALAVLVFVAPGMVVDCREISAMGGGLMSCCTPSGEGAGFRSDCCAVSERTSTERPASTTASARPAADALAVTTAALPLAGPAITPAFETIDLLDTGPPPDLLYIRFGAIRR